MADRRIHEYHLPAFDLANYTASNIAGKQYWDAVVVGAGVAGATIARHLAGRGHSVLLAERKTFPRYKVCGCCLNRRSLRYLNEAGLGAALSNCGAPAIHGVSLYAGKRKANLALPGGMAVSRNLLDGELARAAEAAGARLCFGTAATLSDGDRGAFRAVTLSQGAGESQVRARLVIAADGLSGKLMEGAGPPRIARSGRIGLGALAPGAAGTVDPGQIHMLCGRRGYVGYVRVECGGLAFAAAVQPAALRQAGGAAGCIRSIFKETGQGPPIDFAALHWTGTPLLTRQSRNLSGHRLVALGDAGGYVEPFTGEGMAWALEAAHHLDAHLAGHLPEEWDAAAERWGRFYRRLLFRRSLWCRALSTGLRFPALTTSAVGLLSRAPSLSAPVVWALNNTTRS